MQDPNTIVIGAGIAGMVASLEATSGGAKVTILDKLSRDVIWGDDISTSPWGSGNETSRAQGGGLDRFSETMPISQALERHIELGWGRVDVDLIRSYLEKVGEDCTWLRDTLGIPYEGSLIKGNGPGLCSFLHKLAEKAGVSFSFDTRAIKLLTDDMGRVTGVKARTSDCTTDLKAKAVVLSTGGYEGNQEMMIKYAGPDITYGTVITGCPTNTGDGHLMALEIGAQLINGSVCHIRTTDRFYGPGPTRHLHNIYHFGVFVNRDCNRFIDEGKADSDMIANAIAFQPGQVAALIFDDKARNICPGEYETYPRKEDIIKVVHTIQEIAEVIEVSPSRLQKRIEEFNAAIEEDKALGLDIPKTSRALPIDTPPFFCFHPVVPGLNHPLGGLKINTKAQVLDRENNPIPGLYAAGSIVNWAFGRPFEVGDVKSYKGSYHAGKSSGLATALVFGRAAGRNAAAEILIDKE